MGAVSPGPEAVVLGRVAGESGVGVGGVEVSDGYVGPWAGAVAGFLEVVLGDAGHVFPSDRNPGFAVDCDIWCYGWGVWAGYLHAIGWVAQFAASLRVWVSCPAGLSFDPVPSACGDWDDAQSVGHGVHPDVCSCLGI